MISRTRRSVGRIRAVVGVFAVAALALVACGSSSSGPSGSSATTAGNALASAQAATNAAFKGSYRPVDPLPRPAAKGKKIVVIANGLASISSQIPSSAAVAAAKAAGWQVDLYDAKLNPANWAPLVRQAVAAGANGIVLDAIDCQTIQQPLREAKAKGIAIVPIYAFDCTDKLAGAGSEALFRSQIYYSPKSAVDIDALAESYGADQANYIIADSGNKAKVILVQDPTFTVVKYTSTGFRQAIEASGGSKVVAMVQVTPADVLGGRLIPKIQPVLLQHPEATWIKSPYSYVTQLGIVPTVAGKAGRIKVMGGEGFAPELDLIRQGKVTAVNIISSEWVGWASVDTLNSFFRKEQVRDSGLGWTIADKEHNLPASGEFVPPVDFKAEYKKAWGVG